MIATYRLQLEPTFGFSSVISAIPYLCRLGISHLYLSPISEARVGSTHGYDVINHNLINPELEGAEGWEALLEAARRSGLKIILDFVPNHAGVGPHNERWQNVLAFGQISRFANFFDIDWNPLEESLRGKVLLPFLGQPYGQCLNEGAIQLIKYGRTFRASYGEHNFALAPFTYAEVLSSAMRQHERSNLYFDLKELQEGYAALSPQDVRRAEMLEARLDRCAQEVNWETVLASFSGTKLHEILEKQNWRLAYWKAASYEINYRRFFDVNGLFALRIQNDEVFWDTHQLISELLGRDEVEGLRIDHVDGLFDPQAYLDRLRELGARHVWVEKILAAGETLPDGWAVEGTTGYEFMNDTMQVLLQPAGFEAISRTYQRFVQDGESFRETARDSKRLVMETSLASELHRLAYELNRLCKADYHTRDFAMGALREALAELIAALDRYRTYLPYGQDLAKEVMHAAAQRAMQKTPSFEPSIYDFILKVIHGDLPEQLLETQQAWVGRFQQYCSAVAAKGVEDTTFYRYMPLVALNEVGGAPIVGEQPIQAFHSHARFRLRYHPLNMLATATHDHKRGEDTRMRLIALTELPEMWDESLRALIRIGDAHCNMHGPSRHDQYLFYQILAATWPAADSAELGKRLSEYMLKATRESKRQTSWNNQNTNYESALETFVSGVVADNQLATTIEPLAKNLARIGFYNSLSQLVLKCVSPGVPDFYQGTELLDLSLVDPDNRRAVNFHHREELLSEALQIADNGEASKISALLETCSEGAKMYFTSRLLNLRRDQQDLLMSGSYRELGVSDCSAEHWIVFAREFEGAAIIALVPRLHRSEDTSASGRVELDEKLNGRAWVDCFTGMQFKFDNRVSIQELPLRWAVLYSGATN